MRKLEVHGLSVSAGLCLFGGFYALYTNEANALELKTISHEPSAINTVRRAVLHTSKISAEHATENAGEVRMMAESVAVGDGQATRKSRNTNGLACPIGGADGRREALAGQWRSGIKNLQMTIQ